MELAKQSTRTHAPIVLLAVILSAPVLAFPDTGVWHGMRPFLLQAVAFGSLALLLARVRWSVEGLCSFLTTGPNLALILFIGWTSLSFGLMAPAGGRARAIALAELMRLASGAAIYFAVVYRCNSRDHLKWAALLLLLGGVLASAAGMLSAGISKSNGATGAYGNRQLLAAVLVLLLPVAIVFAQTGEKFIRPLFSTTAALRCLLATLATVMLVATLLLTNNRSSWLGSVVGLLVITTLLLRRRKRQEERKHHWIASPVVASVCLIMLLVLLGTGSGVVDRARTLIAPTQADTFRQRLQLWSICEQMIRDRPVMGFGVGSFPMKAGDYSAATNRSLEQPVTSSGPEIIGVPAAAQVEQEGASMSSVPHNEYLQLAAEQGFVGLLLYFAVLLGFFYRGIRALPHVAKIGRSRKLMLIAAMGAIAAQCVDAIGNPGWRFGDVSPLFWLMMGLGVAATRTHRESRRAVNDEIGLRTPNSIWLGLNRLGRHGIFAVLAVILVTLSFTETKGTLLQGYVIAPAVVGSSAGVVIVIPAPAPSPTPTPTQIPSHTAETIAADGPAFPETFNMSDFSMEAFVQGDWPMVICYELEANSTATVTIGDGKHSFVIQLPSTNGQQREDIRQIPTEFGTTPVVGVLSFRALKDGPEPRKLAPFFLCGIGLGPHGVGSMVIDQLNFRPGTLYPASNVKTGDFSFHSISDFANATPEFRLEKHTDHGNVLQLVRRLATTTLSIGQVSGGQWDGKNSKGQVSWGRNRFVVRGWRGLVGGGDSSTALGPLVKVQ